MADDDGFGSLSEWLLAMMAAQQHPEKPADWRLRPTPEEKDRRRELAEGN
jgi:hypothetical protein